MPELSQQQAQEALALAQGWVKLAVLTAQGLSADEGRVLLEKCDGSLRQAMQQLQSKGW